MKELVFQQAQVEDIAFSVDTLLFDTVFTELGSATYFFKVYNKNKNPIKIDKIELEQGQMSSFRLNIDGIPAKSLEEVEILGNDSIYIFAEVTINPDAPLSISPFILEERILFTLGEKKKDLLLQAWGQNANYFPSRFNKGIPVVLSCNNREIIWNDPKPYVIYGEIFIDQCALIIPAGARIYVHGGIARNDVFGVFNDGIIYVLEKGKIIIEGTYENPVVIQGDRLESAFSESPGQWLGIILGKGSIGNKISHTTIKNSIFGVYVDSAAVLNTDNSQFYNTTSSGIIGFRSTIRANNCLIHTNYSTSVNLVFGGNYEFNHCTIGSYGVDADGLALSNFYCYDDPLFCNQRRDFRMIATFNNCIIGGSRKDEIRMVDVSNGNDPQLFQVKFSNSAIKGEQIFTKEQYFIDCVRIKNDDKLFLNVNQKKFELDTNSIALGIGKPIINNTILLRDLAGKERKKEKPDAGCFEY
jgi:LEA14-like dessication related protein